MDSCASGVEFPGFVAYPIETGKGFGLLVEQSMSSKKLLRMGRLLLLPIALTLVFLLVTGCDNLQHPPEGTELFWGVAISMG